MIKSKTFKRLYKDYTKKFIEVSKEKTLSELVHCNNIAWDSYAKFGPLLDNYDVFLLPF